MSIWEVILLGIGLSMDACAVSMTNGLNEPKMKMKKCLLIAFFYGLFQALMPLIGYFAGSIFTNFITKFTPWLALVLLSFIGINMLIEGIKTKKDEQKKSLTIKMLTVQAFTTAIDALAVGILFCNQRVLQVLTNVILIGIITFTLAFISVHIGKKFGCLLERNAKLFGGIILIAIGLKIFIEYLITLF